MNTTLFTIIASLLIISGIILYCFSIILYLRIRAFRQSRTYRGFLYEHANFISDLKALRELIYYLPLSRYFRNTNVQYQQNVEESEILKELWQRKYKLELVLTILFILGLVSILIVQYF